MRARYSRQLFAPGVLGIDKPAANVAYIGGSLISTVAVIAMGEVVRAGRYLLGPLGLAIEGAEVVPGRGEHGGADQRSDRRVAGGRAGIAARTEEGELRVMGSIRGLRQPRLPAGVFQPLGVILHLAAGTVPISLGTMIVARGRRQGQRMEPF